MKFSVIIPVYNAQDKLNRCLDSIINQSFDDYEIILVNDGSSDNSESICRDYASKYSNIRFFTKKNGGASSARNTGLNEAKGDYVLFVDCDDYVNNDFFEILDENCIKNGLSVFTYTWLKDNGFQKRMVHTNNDLPFFEKAKAIILNRSINSPCAKAFDRELIERISLRFDERMPVAEDFNFCVKYLLSCESLEVFDKSIYFYDMTNENSLVHKRKSGLIDIYPIVFNAVYEDIKDSRFSDDEKRQLYRAWDKLHTDSFVTCVMEEIKDDTLSSRQIRKEISKMCVKFQREYETVYGYENLIHFAVRFCIRFNMENTLYILSKIYMKMR